MTTITNLSPTRLELPRKLSLPVLDALDDNGDVLALVTIKKDKGVYVLGMKRKGDKFGLEITLNNYSSSEHRQALEYLAACLGFDFDWDSINDRT